MNRRVTGCTLCACGYLCAAILLAVAACGHGRQLSAQREDTVGVAGRSAARIPFSLRSPDDLPFDFFWRQRVRARWVDGQADFDAVLQKRDHQLSLIGLTPLGTPMFVLKLDRQARVTVENRSGRRLGFNPRHILADIQRVYFPWLPPPRPNYSGDLRGRAGLWTIIETFERGQLKRRNFLHYGSSKLSVEVVYTDWPAGQDVARRVKLRHKRYGYTLEVVTLSAQRLGRTSHSQGHGRCSQKPGYRRCDRCRLRSRRQSCEASVSSPAG